MCLVGHNPIQPSSKRERLCAYSIFLSLSLSIETFSSHVDSASSSSRKTRLISSSLPPSLSSLPLLLPFPPSPPPLWGDNLDHQSHILPLVVQPSLRHSLRKRQEEKKGSFSSMYLYCVPLITTKSSCALESYRRLQFPQNSISSPVTRRRQAARGKGGGESLINFESENEVPFLLLLLLLLQKSDKLLDGRRGEKK